MRALSKFESQQHHQQTYASIQPGTFFTEQIGATFPPIHRLFLCIQNDPMMVIEVSSTIAKAHLRAVVAPVPYFNDPNVCINTVNYLDPADPKAVEATRECERLLKKSIKGYVGS